MRWSRTSWALAGLVIFHAGGAVAQGPHAPEVEIQTMLDESAASWNRGDLDGHLADNADSISFMTRSGPIVGKTRTADALRRSFFKNGKPVQQLRFERVTIRRLGDGHALAEVAAPPSLLLAVPDWVNQVVNWRAEYRSEEERMRVAVELARQNVLRAAAAPSGQACSRRPAAG